MSNELRFSKIVKIEESTINQKMQLSASEQDLKYLAERFDIFRINKLELEYIITLKDDIPNAYTLICRLVSNVTKFLINDFEENTEIDEKFDVVLLEEEVAKNHMEQLEDMDIEIINEQEFDIAEIAAQYLSLCVYM